MNKLNILLTGSGGMVGRNIVDKKPEHVSLLTPDFNQLNLLNYDQVFTYLKKNKPGVIIHAAGIVGGIQANINHPVKFLRENTLMAHNLIWAEYENKIPYFLNLGSSCMYPAAATNPLNEELILTGKLEPSNEGYALSKIFSQRFCSYINTELGSPNYKTIIPCNLYGKYDKFDAEWGHMIPSAIQKIHQAKIMEEAFVSIWGDGTARREFMYAEDLADFIWTAVDRIDEIPELINVGLGHDYTINEYYKAIAEVVGYTGEFQHDLSNPVGMKQKLVDTNLLRQINWTPKTDLKEGLTKTYNYFLRNINKNEY
ncbi:MAG: NAD-dependent epimerase/dehydratase family protein [Bacteroidetes bacterium]|nr:NAD-dependent epimerase/dehydratase family protein [Bacteroidota bacterium]